MTTREPLDAQQRRNSLVPLPVASGKRHGLPLPSLAEAVVGASVAISVSAIAAECASGRVRRWAVGHPITIGVLVGLVLLVLAVLGIERALSVAESRRWEVPALESLNTWVFAADQAIKVVGEGLKEAARSMSTPPPDTALLSSCVEALAARDPDRLRAVSNVIRDEASRVAAVAMSGTSVVARARPYEGSIELIFEAQRALDEIADICWMLPFAVRAEGDVGTVARQQAARILPLLHTVGDNATHLRLCVLQARHRNSAA